MATNNLPIANPTTMDIRSIHDFQFKKSHIQKIYKQQGDGFNTLDIYRSLKRTGKVANETMTAEEEPYDIRTITLGTVTVDSNDQLTFTLDADDVDEGGRYYPRVGFTVTFGNTITGFTQARLTSVTSDGGSPATITCVAYRYNTGQPTFNALDVAGSTPLASGTEIAITDGAFATETGQPNATSLGTVERTFYSQILKETISFGGMELAKQKWIPKHGIGLYNSEINRVEFALDRQVEAALTMGQANNSGLEQASEMSSSNNPIYKIKGLWSWIDELGGEVTYTGGTGWEFDDFSEMAEYFESQGVTESTILVLCGGNFMRRVEDSGVSFVQGTSGGLATDNFFYQEGGDMIMSGSPDTYLNVGFRGIRKAGNLFLFKTLNMFTNPFQFGIDAYMLNDAAMAFPVSMVKDKKTGFNIPNFELKDVGLGKYNRGRVVGGLAGMDGFMQQYLNYPLTSQIDGNNFYWLHHCMATFMEANKAMLIRRTS